MTESPSDVGFPTRGPHVACLAVLPPLPRLGSERGEVELVQGGQVRVPALQSLQSQAQPAHSLSPLAQRARAGTNNLLGNLAHLHPGLPIVEARVIGEST